MSITKLKNKHIVYSRISEANFWEILKYCIENIEASKITNLAKNSKATLCKIYRNLKILMYKEHEKISKFSGKIWIYESYFGYKRAMRKRSSKSLLSPLLQAELGILKRNGNKDLELNSLLSVLITEILWLISRLWIQGSL